MDVQMRDRFAGIPAIIDHQPKSGLQHAELFRNFPGSQEHAAEEFRLCGLGLGNPRNAPARNKEHMDWRLRLCIVKSDEIIRLVHEFRGNFPGGNSFENSHAT
jgi:hypothetical protein